MAQVDTEVDFLARSGAAVIFHSLASDLLSEQPTDPTAWLMERLEQKRVHLTPEHVVALLRDSPEIDRDVFCACMSCVDPAAFTFTNHSDVYRRLLLPAANRLLELYSNDPNALLALQAQSGSSSWWRSVVSVAITKQQLAAAPTQSSDYKAFIVIPYTVYGVDISKELISDMLTCLRWVVGSTSRTDLPFRILTVPYPARRTTEGEDASTTIELNNTSDRMLDRVIADNHWQEFVTNVPGVQHAQAGMDTAILCGLREVSRQCREELAAFERSLVPLAEGQQPKATPWNNVFTVVLPAAAADISYIDIGAVLLPLLGGSARAPGVQTDDAMTPVTSQTPQPQGKGGKGQAAAAAAPQAPAATKIPICAVAAGLCGSGLPSLSAEEKLFLWGLRKAANGVVQLPGDCYQLAPPLLAAFKHSAIDTPVDMSAGVPYSCTGDSCALVTEMMISTMKTQPPVVVPISAGICATQEPRRHTPGQLLNTINGLVNEIGKAAPKKEKDDLDAVFKNLQTKATPASWATAANDKFSSLLLSHDITGGTSPPIPWHEV